MGSTLLSLKTKVFLGQFKNLCPHGVYERHSVHSLSYCCTLFVGCVSLPAERVTCWIFCHMFMCDATHRRQDSYSTWVMSCRYWSPPRLWSHTIYTKIQYIDTKIFGSGCKGCSTNTWRFLKWNKSLRKSGTIY